MIKTNYSQVRSAPLHPIIDQAMTFMQPGEAGGERFRIDAIGARKLEVALGRADSTRDLSSAILELMQFAHYMERQEDSPKAASILWTVAFTMMNVLQHQSRQIV